MLDADDESDERMMLSAYITIILGDDVELTNHRPFTLGQSGDVDYS